MMATQKQWDYLIAYIFHIMEFFDITDNNNSITPENGASLIEKHKWSTNEEMLSIIEKPSEDHIFIFFDIIENNMLSYGHLQPDEQQRMQTWLLSWQNFFLTNLSKIQQKIETTKNNDDIYNFVNVLYALLQEQKYIKSANIPIVIPNMKVYENITNTSFPVWMDIFSDITSVYKTIDKEGQKVTLTTSNRSSISMYNKMLWIIQSLSIQDIPLYDNKTHDRLIAIQDALKTCINDTTGNTSWVENYLQAVMTCLVAHKNIHEWIITEDIKKDITSILSLAQGILQQQKNNKINTQDIWEISIIIFYRTMISQISWENINGSLLKALWTNYATLLQSTDIQKPHIDTDRLAKATDTLFESLTTWCTEYNAITQDISINKAYRITKDDATIKIIFMEDKKEIPILFEYWNIWIIKASTDEGHIFLTLDHIKELIEHEDFQRIIDEIHTTVQNSTKEKKQFLRDFDLPKNEPIQYMRIFQNNDNNIIPGTFLFSQALEQQLETSYMLNTSQPQITGDPETIIQSTIQTSYPSQKNFFFDIYAHGSPSQLLFEKPLTADFLIKLSKDYPDCKFFISTLGCYGWWLVDMVKEWKDLKNLYIFTQAKNYLPNTPDRWSTIYSNTLLKSLHEWKPYGESIYEADKAANEANISDPETFLWGEYIAKQESKKEQQSTTA